MASRISPLVRRIPRELVHNAGKYLGLFALIAMTICFASGFLVAARSAIRLVAEQRAQANMEDFSFTTQFEAPDDALAAVEAVGSGCTVYQNYQTELDASVGANDGITLRLYKDRDVFNLPTYYEGTPPAKANEVALDRVFAKNLGLGVGDTFTAGGTQLTVTGILVLPDYQTLVRSNTSIMYDATTFAVGLVTPETFDRLADGQVTYRYAALLDEKDMDLVARTTYEQDVAKALQDNDVQLTDLSDKDAILSRVYADEDMEGDQAIWITLCSILIVVSAFVFVVLTDATVESESAMIGTLLASGYRKGELIRHYLTLPMIVGLAAAAVGNAIGYGVMADVMSGLYYSAYSLPPFHAYFFADVFVLTTVVPVLLLFVVTLVGVARKMRATPLAFLRHEVGRKSRRSNLALPERWGFVARFRARVFARNASHFAVLFVGIMFSSVLIFFGVCLMPLMNHFADQMAQDLPAEHLYLLKAPLEIDVDDDLADAAAAYDTLLGYDDPKADLPAAEYRRLALTASGLIADPRVLAGHPLNTLANSDDAVDQAEQAAITTLDLPRAYSAKSEEVTVYGIEVGSDYWHLDVSGGKIVVGAGLAEKCALEVGRPATFTNRYTGDTYTLVPDAVAGTDSDMGVYMSRATWAEVFADDAAEGDASYFNAYASDEPLNLAARYVAGERTPHEMAAMADQMTDMFGDMMTVLVGLAVAISAVLIYLLTKTAIDRSARYISYMKVFGYHSKEVDYLYLRPITYTVVASYVLSMPLVVALMSVFVRVMMADYAGNITLWFTPPLLVKVVAIGLSSYLIVAALHVLRVRRINLTEAMKVQE